MTFLKKYVQFSVDIPALVLDTVTQTEDTIIQGKHYFIVIVDFNTRHLGLRTL